MDRGFIVCVMIWIYERFWEVSVGNEFDMIGMCSKDCFNKRRIIRYTINIY